MAMLNNQMVHLEFLFLCSYQEWVMGVKVAESKWNQPQRISQRKLGREVTGF